MDKIKVSKIEAAHQQLEMAISLWFNDEDFVSTHTLASAAHQVLSDLCKNKKDFITVKQGLIEIGSQISEDLKRRMIKELNEAQNFFKHADKDNSPDISIEYKPIHTEAFIWDACLLYQKTAGIMTVPMRIMNIWVWMTNVEKLSIKSEADQKILEFKQKHVGESKQSLYKELMEIWQTSEALTTR
jgi:hypothetical protein